MTLTSLGPSLVQGGNQWASKNISVAVPVGDHQINYDGLISKHIASGAGEFVSETEIVIFYISAQLHAAYCTRYSTSRFIKYYNIRLMFKKKRDQHFQLIMVESGFTIQVHQQEQLNPER